MFENIKGDLMHYKRYCNLKAPLWALIPRIIYSHPASVGVVWYRFGQAGQRCRLPLLCQILKLIYYLTFPLARLYSGVQVSLTASIKPGLVILHYGGVVIAHGSTMGADCLLHHNVNLVAYRDANGPHIGDRFYAGVGVTVVDEVIIEDDVSVGAGSVITKSVPRDAIVAGMPAKILRFRREKEHPSENKTMECRKPGWLASPAKKDTRPR